MTVTPAARAFSIAGTIALDCAGVIRMPFAPLVTMFSIAVIWVWTSVSVLPAAVVSSALFASGGLLRRFLHLHEERVRLGLGDQADHDLLAAVAA